MVHYTWQPVPKGTIGTVICPFQPATLQKPTAPTPAPTAPNPTAPAAPVAPAAPPPAPTGGIPAPPPSNIPAAPPLAPQAPSFKTSIAGPYQVPLEIGDSIYILEEYNIAESSSRSSKHKKRKQQATWYRGYVFQCASPTSAKPLLGIFPASYVYTSYGNDNFEDLLKDDDNRISILSSKRISTIKEDETEEDSKKVSILKENDDIIPEDEEIRIRNYRNNFDDDEEDDDDFIRPGAMQRKKTLGNSSDLRMRALMIKEHIHQPLPASIEPTHTTTAGQDEILVDEIACTLREWGFLLKQYLKQQKYDLFTTIRELFQILFQVKIIKYKLLIKLRIY